MEGFSWGAFVFTVLWALWQRMWVVGLLLFALTSGLAVAANLELIGPGLASLLQLAVALVFGFEGRNLLISSLEGSGYRRVGLIQASTEESAELAYFAERAPAPVQAAAPSRLRAMPEDTLGMFGDV